MKYLKNDLVWAKFDKYPWWPAYIKAVKKDRYEVSFFGDFSWSYLKDDKIKNLYEMDSSNLRGQLKTSYK